MDKSYKRTIELLAPAGDRECFMSAIKAGADAVYLAGNKFGARAYADNLSDEELLWAIDTAHLYDRKLYLTVNTLLKNNEINELYDYLSPLYEAGLDAVIVQDAGVISLLLEAFPGLDLHASTQMAVTDVEGVKLLKDMGLTRVVPARELSLEELKNIYDETGMEVECFIHGALCYSYSGKCLFSSLVGGRSGNRGRCAGPCRLPYNNKYILSARDISTLDMLPDLIDSGICSFKIEGRMKSKEYVAAVTGIYRKYIDKYLADPDALYRVDDEDLKDIEELYTRSGHCHGYFYKNNGRDMITVDKPSYNTGDEDRMKRLYERYTGKGSKLKCKAELMARAGQALKVNISSKGYMTECSGERVDKARKSPTGKDSLRQHFDKLGDTCFELEAFDIDAGSDIFVPVSAINALRREAFGILKDEILKPYRRNKPVIKEYRAEKVKKDTNTEEYDTLVNIRTDRLELLDTVIGSGLADIVSVDINAFCTAENKGYRIDRALIRSTADRIHKEGGMFFLVLPYVIRRGFFVRNDILTDILREDGIDGVAADNYESLYYLLSIGYSGYVIGDIHLYALNDRAVVKLNDLGAPILTYPVELNTGELNRLDIDKGEFILYGHVPMMISAQCTEKTQNKCLMDNGISYISDRYGNSFPVKRDCSECSNTIFNCVPYMITSYKDVPVNVKPWSYRIHFTVEDKEEAKAILSCYRDMFEGREISAPVKRTLGHLKRGVE